MKQPAQRELLTAIHAKCRDCSGGSQKAVYGCSVTSCPLWPYRQEEHQRDTVRKNQVTMFELFKEAANA